MWDNIFSNFIPLSGDKKFAEDKAIVGGLAKIDDLSVMIIGNEKGQTQWKKELNIILEWQNQKVLEKLNV